jgi:hypothetical protein
VLHLGASELTEHGYSLLANALRDGLFPRMQSLHLHVTADNAAGATRVLHSLVRGRCPTGCRVRRWATQQLEYTGLSLTLHVCGSIPQGKPPVLQPFGL